MKCLIMYSKHWGGSEVKLLFDEVEMKYFNQSEILWCTAPYKSGPLALNIDSNTDALASQYIDENDVVAVYSGNGEIYDVC